MICEHFQVLWEQMSKSGDLVKRQRYEKKNHNNEDSDGGERERFENLSVVTDRETSNDGRQGQGKVTESCTPQQPY